MSRILLFESSDNWESKLALLGQTTDHEVVYWVSTNPKATKHTHLFDHPKLEGRTYRGDSLEIIGDLLPHIPTFIDMYSRNYRPDAQNIYRNLRLHEYQNIFHLLAEEIATIYKDNTIDTFIIPRIPHLGVDYLFYVVARSLGVRTFLLNQSLFPNRFFVSTTISDFGRFEFTPDYQPLQQPPPEWLRPQPGNWFYMQAETQAHRAQSLLAKTRQMARQALTPREGKDAYLEMEIAQNLSFQARLSDQAIEDPNLSVPFIYFPLHLQPEMTTSAIGGDYTDQLLALEKLSCRLPSGWRIYAKENPKQTAFMRSASFFHRLNAIPNVDYVAPSVPTSILIERSRLIATVTGTAGWEALTLGRPVLYFGLPWYRRLPGALAYHEDINVTETASMRISQSDLSGAVAKLLQKMPTGVIYSGYESMVSGYDPEKNTKQVVASLEQILAQ
jgi:hypothetical protein